MRKNQTRAIVICLALLGMLTVFAGGSVLFDLFDMREREGNYILYIVWANFISSILYLAAAYGLFKMKKWSVWLLVISVVILVAAFIGLKLHISEGGLYEVKTLNAMIFRIGLTALLAVASYFLLQNKQLSKNEKI